MDESAQGPAQDDTAKASAAANSERESSIQQHMANMEKVLLDVHSNPTKYRDCKQKRSVKTMQVSEQFLIGKTIGRTAKPKSGSEQYYKQHNMADRQHEMVYVRPICESGKPDWQKDLYYNDAKPLIEMIDPEYARDEDYAMQVSVYDSDRGDFCQQHTDDKDIAPQIMMCLGDFTGGELRLTLGDRSQDVALKNRIVKLDARLPHEVRPFEGVRISVIFYKRYDRHIKTPLPITEDVNVLYDGQGADGNSDSASDPAATSAGTAASSASQLVDESAQGPAQDDTADASESALRQLVEAAISNEADVTPVGAYELAEAIVTHELGENWYTACGSGPQSRMGTIIKDAFVHLAAQMTEGATFYDIGAGYGLILIAMHLLGHKIQDLFWDVNWKSTTASRQTRLFANTSVMSVTCSRAISRMCGCHRVHASTTQTIWRSKTIRAFSSQACKRCDRTQTSRYCRPM